MQEQESGGSGDPDVGKKMPERKAVGEWGRVADRGASLGATVLRFSCFVRRGGRRGQPEETARQAVFKGDVSVAARAAPGTVCVGDFILGHDS